MDYTFSFFLILTLVPWLETQETLSTVVNYFSILDCSSFRFFCSAAPLEMVAAASYTCIRILHCKISWNIWMIQWDKLQLPPNLLQPRTSYCGIENVKREKNSSTEDERWLKCVQCTREHHSRRLPVDSNSIRLLRQVQSACTRLDSSFELLLLIDMFPHERRHWNSIFISFGDGNENAIYIISFSLPDCFNALENTNSSYIFESPIPTRKTCTLSSHILSHSFLASAGWTCLMLCKSVNFCTETISNWNANRVMKVEELTRIVVMLPFEAFIIIENFCEKLENLPSLHIKEGVYLIRLLMGSHNSICSQWKVSRQIGI